MVERVVQVKAVGVLLEDRGDGFAGGAGGFGGVGDDALQGGEEAGRAVEKLVPHQSVGAVAHHLHAGERVGLRELVDGEPGNVLGGDVGAKYVVKLQGLIHALVVGSKIEPDGRVHGFVMRRRIEGPHRLVEERAGIVVADERVPDVFPGVAPIPARRLLTKPAHVVLHGEVGADEDAEVVVVNPGGGVRIPGVADDSARLVEAIAVGVVAHEEEPLLLGGEVGDKQCVLAE